MSRHTCGICKKKRYKKYMEKVIFLKTNIYYDELTKHFVCISCKPLYIKKLSVQGRQLKEIIKSLSTPVDND